VKVNNDLLLNLPAASETEVVVVKHIESAELDEMWAFVESKEQQR
jgi:hypothetical protein